MATIIEAHPGMDETIEEGVPANTGYITPNESYKRALIFTLMTSSAAAPLAGWVTDFLPLLPNLAIAFGAWAVAFRKAVATLPHKEIAVQYAGVRTIFGWPVNHIHGAGEHVLFWGEDLEPVSTEPLPYDPPTFQVLARDRAAVWVDAYFTATIVDPFRWRTHGGEETREMLINEFNSKIRLFIQNVNKAVQITELRDVLAEYLKLHEDADQIDRFMNEKLRPLTWENEQKRREPVFGDQEINRLKVEAGKFCSSATDWGYEINDINTEDVDLDPEVRAAAAKRAAQRDELAMLDDRQRQRRKWVKELKKELPNLPDQAAMSAVDMLLDLPVTRSITEIDFPALGDFAKSPDFVRAVQAIAARMPRKQQRRNRNGSRQSQQ